jgi:hypothetical protein
MDVQTLLVRDHLGGKLVEDQRRTSTPWIRVPP